MKRVVFLVALGVTLQAGAAVGQAPAAAPVTDAAPLVAAPPLPRPEALGVALPLGPVCDADWLVGVPLPEITGPGGCGVPSPVELSSAAGVTLDPPAVLSCGAARALAAWLVSDVKPAAAAAGDRLMALDVAATYACRSRNNQPGAKLSEHGLGRAIDVAAFRLGQGSGSTSGATSGVAVAPDAPSLVPTARAAACGPFSTVLGPGSDAFHEAHLHLDVAERRHAPYCR